MTVLDHSPRQTYAPRLHRRHEIVTTLGMDGVLGIGAALRSWGFAVREFLADVREGVGHSTVICTVSLTSTECAGFAERLGALPGVVSVDPR